MLCIYLANHTKKIYNELSTRKPYIVVLILAVSKFSLHNQYWFSEE